MAGGGNADFEIPVRSLLRWAINLGILALIVQVRLFKKLWPFLKFTGLWVPFLVLWLYGAFETVGLSGVWGLFFLGSWVFVASWTYRSIQRKRATPPAHTLAKAAEAKPVLHGVFFGIKPPATGFWGKPIGEPQPVTKPIDEDGHILVIGGAGSGKSSCIAIPTLKSYWDGRFLAIDIKGELAEKSERQAHIFNPMKQDALGYDPFYLVRESGKNPVPDIRAIALALAPLSPENRDPFWIQAAQNILTGHLLFGFKNGASFIETIDVLQSVPPRKLLETEVKDEQACRYLSSVVDVRLETLGSIMAQIGNAVSVFATDPDVQAALTKKEIITPDLLERGENIFLQLPEYKLEQWKQLLSLIVQQFLTHFERRAEGNQAPILFMLDEFARIGKIETILHGLATLRSKKITICILTQSLAQLDAIYGREQRQIIADNCAYKAILRATDAETQEYFSKLVGTEEREKRSYNREGMDASPIGGSGMGTLALNMILGSQTTSTSISTEEKRVIKPEDFAYLQDIVLLTPHGFQRVQKVPYYTTSHPSSQARVAAVQVSQKQTAAVPTGVVTLAQTAQEHPPEKHEPAQMGQASSEEYRKYDLALEKACYPGTPGVPMQTQCATFYAGLPPEERLAFRQYWERQEQANREVPQKVQACRMILSAAARVEHPTQHHERMAAATQGGEEGTPVQAEPPPTLPHQSQAETAPLPTAVLQFLQSLQPHEQVAFLRVWHQKQQEEEQTPGCPAVPATPPVGQKEGE